MSEKQTNVEQEFYEKFKTELNATTAFPGVYTYKFIVKTSDDSQSKVTALFDPKEAVMTIKPSSKGTYNSITISQIENSADDVIKKYRAAAKIPGVILL